MIAKYSWKNASVEVRCRGRTRVVATRAVSDASRPNVVIIGSGWAGFGAAKALTEAGGVNVTLLEASNNPGGLAAGYRTKTGKEVEAGMKGFWYQYANIFAMLKELGLEGSLTPFTTSGFWNPNGLLTEAPVFSKLPRLPTLVGQFVHTFPKYWSLSLQDRMTMIPFLTTCLDYSSSPERFEQYDQISAFELFRQFGVSKKAYEEFLRPTLLVSLFASGEQLSAAVVLETLYFYALAHQSDFDVCWCRGSIAEKIFKPLVDRIDGGGGQLLGGKLVTGLEVQEEGPSGKKRVTRVTALDRTTGSEEVYEADAVIFSVGIGGMQKLIANSPALAESDEFSAINNLRSIDCIATRVWLDKRVDCRFPANALSSFEPEAGMTFFDLNALHDEYKDPSIGSVITADFYGSNALMSLPDQAIIDRVMKHITKCEPGFKGAKVLDSAVLRFPKAVSCFSPGSFKHRPTQTPPSFSNVFISGDWVKGVPHGANGLSQERSYVTGLRAANLCMDQLESSSSSSSFKGINLKRAKILDVEADEPHIALGKMAVKSVRQATDAIGLKSPFL